MRIVIDTREQRPFVFRKSKLVEGTIRNKLNAGDYSIEGYENNIALERKSPNDLFQTLGKGHKRFKKELERAIGFDYFAIIVEVPFTTIIDKEFENAHYSGMLGDTIIQICYTLKMKYGVDVIFCNGRNEATRICRHIFRAYYKMKETPNSLINNPDNVNFLAEIVKFKKKLRCDR